METFFCTVSFVSTLYPVLSPSVSNMDSIISPPVSMLESISSWFDLTLSTFPTIVTHQDEEEILNMTMFHQAEKEKQGSLLQHLENEYTLGSGTYVITKENFYAITTVITTRFSLVIKKVRNTEEQFIKLLLSSFLPIWYSRCSPSVLTILGGGEDMLRGQGVGIP